MSAFVAFDPAAAHRVLERPCGGAGNMHLPGSGRSVATASAHEPPRRHTFVQASRLIRALVFDPGMMRLTPTAGGARTCSRDLRLLGRLGGLLHWSHRHPGTSLVTCSRWNSGMIPMYRSRYSPLAWSLMSDVEAARSHS